MSDEMEPTEDLKAEPAPEAATPRKRRPWLKYGCSALVLIVAGVTIWLGPVIRDFMKAGVLQGVLGGVDKRKYEGDTIDNLRAMHTAMMVYHDSEGAFPDATGWMDAIEPRLQTYDMEKKESQKKLVSPEFVGQAGKYGYAMNLSASQKYIDDIPEPSKMPLIFDSSDTGRNAHGNPQGLLPNPPRVGGNKGISSDGTLLKF